MKYESVKEALGKLVEWGGAGVGMLVGLASARYGLPVSPGVASTGGAIIGGMVGSQGKAVVVAGFDHLRERRDERRAAAARRGGTSPRAVSGAAHAPMTGSRGAGHRGPRAMSSRRSSTPSIAGQVIGGIEQVIEQLDRAASRIAAIHQKMWANQNSLLGVLAGSRPEIVRATEATLTTARGLVHDSVGELTAAKRELGAYRSRL
ncbi:hypothetical protein [Micromonospora sp. KC213]|uniref:hypothetical protein n=1 Tax=Micromonospora sp. KC213 TaxID=2530378 RepID=UPI001045159E|nr:hypothetical protein [Micromonospora sp. KC213]TDC38846.1 hypothetical protein E1166_17740 [Micromonospora sp. KC213]